MKKIFYTIPIISLFISCSKERLSENSVVEANLVSTPQTDLDKWIQNNFSKPYGIDIKYRWDSNNIPKGSHLRPANPEKIKPILEAIKTLWIDLYELPELEKLNFMKGKNPLVIHLYGNKNLNSKGTELMYDPNSTAVEMSIFNVDDFDHKNPDKIYTLMRSVHFQFAKRLMELIPYDRDEFAKISINRYTFSTSTIDALTFKDPLNAFRILDYANKRSFYSIYGTISPEVDFADMISITLTNTPQALQQAETNAKTPRQDTGSDPEVQIRYNEEARVAYQEFIKKRMAVQQYFDKVLKINLNKIQLESIKRIQDYTK